MISVLINVVIVISVFFLGASIGIAWCRKEILRRVKIMQPLFNNTIATLIMRVSTEGMTNGEISDYLDDELNFIKIVTRL